MRDWGSTLRSSLVDQDHWFLCQDEAPLTVAGPFLVSREASSQRRGDDGDGGASTKRKCKDYWLEDDTLDDP